MDANSNCTIYIDEAGDLGIGRGTRWFILSAVVIDKNSELNLRDIIKSIKTKLNIQNIHFRKLRNFEQKAYVTREISKGDFVYINIIVDTSKINIKCKNPNDNPGLVTYNFATRLLIERVSWLLRDKNKFGKIVFSARGTEKDNDLIQYISQKLLPYGFNQVVNRFTGIEAKTASSWDMLQVADICATTMFNYHEENSYGFITPCYSYCLSNSLYSYNSDTHNYGVKYYSEDMKPDKQYFIDKMICK